MASGMNSTPALLIVMGFVANPAVAGMERLDDGEMSDISGQSGVTMEMESQASIDSVSYFTNDSGIHLDDVSVGSASEADEGDFRAYDLDLTDDGRLEVGFDIQDQRMEIGGVRLDDSDDSMGAFWLDRDMSGSFRVGPGTEGDGSYTFDLIFELTDGRLGYSTNGHQVFLDGVTLAVDSQGQSFFLDDDGIINYSVPADVSLEVDGMHYAQGEEGFRGDASSLDSYGGIELDMDFESDYQIQAGSRFGSQGLRIDRETDLNSGEFLYRTDGNALRFADMSGWSSVQGLYIEVAEDWEGRQGLAFTMDSAEGDLEIGSVEIGPASGGGDSFGSFNLDWLYEDQDINGETYRNQVFLQAGGHPDAGPEGMRLASQWSLADANVAYTTNDNTVIFSGLQSWGRGDVTVNVTGDEFLGDTQFYEGLRIGFEDVSGGYRMDGIRVGDEDSDLQAGVELLAPLGVFAHFEYGSMDGHYTIAPGGADGEGMTINSDLVIQDATAGGFIGDNGQGVWATDLDFEGHIRDMTLDVTDEGLAIVQGEAWSTMDIGNLRIGDADDGASFGRIVWQRYGEDNEMVIRPGGGSDGEGEGLTVALTQIFNKASDDRQNRFVWHTGRENDDNSTGVQLVMNDIHTRDGDGTDSNEFGMQTELTVDVREVDSDNGNQPGFSVNSRTRFKELNIGSVDLVNVGEDSTSTMLHGVSIQNVDMESNLTATPID